MHHRAKTLWQRKRKSDAEHVRTTRYRDTDNVGLSVEVTVEGSPPLPLREVTFLSLPPPKAPNAGRSSADTRC